MGVAYDNITNYLYSIGEDKYLKVTRLNTKDIIANYQIGTHPLTNLHFDVYYKRLFITNKHGQIFIYDASSVIILLLLLLYYYIIILSYYYIIYLIIYIIILFSYQ